VLWLGSDFNTNLCIMSLLTELLMYRRFLTGLPRFLHASVSVEEAGAAVRRRLDRREERLLRMAEIGFFGYSRSPYHPLFRLAGCELGDFRALVLENGVDGALRVLRESGVYFTFEEVKGREPVVRAGREIRLDPADFDNPYLTHHYYRSSGGTTGVGTRVSTDLDHLALEAGHRLLLLDAHGVLDVPYAIWRPPLPGSGLNAVLRAAHIGRPPARWFTPVIPGDLKPPLKFVLANEMTVALSRFLGPAIPRPVPVGLNEAGEIARWAADTLAEHGRVLLNTPVSCGLRVGLAAREAGLNLAGATFMIAGEPPTPAKVNGIRASGATHFTDYGMAEAGRLGVGCAKPVGDNDVHVMTDAYAVIPFPREVPVSGETVRSFHITSLHPSTPKLLLNVEFDDFGIVEEKECGCPLGELGLRQHLRDIRSFGKLTGEGVTLVGSDMVRILEQVLPARFGGSPLDYQLVEEEDADGFTRLALRISPNVTLSDESAVLQTFLSAIADASPGADMARSIWAQAGTLVVRREDPYITPRGKQMPLHVVRSERRVEPA
jgi:hypothetical protein